MKCTCTMPMTRGSVDEKAKRRFTSHFRRTCTTLGPSSFFLLSSSYSSKEQNQSRMSSRHSTKTRMVRFPLTSFSTIFIPWKHWIEFKSKRSFFEQISPLDNSSFIAADANLDGVLNRDEFKSANRRFQRRFNEGGDSKKYFGYADKNADGALSKEELRTYANKRIGVPAKTDADLR